jgi:hypothetical protein
MTFQQRQGGQYERSMRSGEIWYAYKILVLEDI